MTERNGKRGSSPNPADRRYAAFFAEFNRGRFFEAHEVLEGLWLDTRGALRDFYKGLIQVAAVYLKLQQGKPDPARRIAARAASHLEAYRPRCEGVDLEEVLGLLNSVLAGNPLRDLSIRTFREFCARKRDNP